MLATSVALRLCTDTKDHHDTPIFDVTAPKNIQRALFARYPTPLPSLDYYNGECTDESTGLDSEDQQPKSTHAWYKNILIHMVLISPKTRSNLAKGPHQSNQKKVSFLDSKMIKKITILGSAQDPS